MHSALLEAREHLALEFMRVGAVLTSASDHPLVKTRGSERGFYFKFHEKTPDAPLAPIYLNLRTPDNPKAGTLTPEVVALGASCMQMLQLKAKCEFDAVVGMPRAGDPFALAFTELTGTPHISMDKWEHKDRRHIASVKGDIPASVKRVLGLDDLITKADTKVEGIMNLRSDGFEITDFVVLVDYERGGRAQLSTLGCALHTLFTITELLDFYVKAGKITPELRTEIHAFLAKVA